jgi:SSS family solute:Na+ symporter
VDIYEKLRPGRPERELLTVGRIATGVVVLFGIIWIPVMHNMAGGGLYRYLQGVQSYLAPPITAVFLLGLFTTRINARGALSGLLVGFVLGMTKLTVEAIHASQPFADGSPLSQFASFNFLYYSGVLMLVSCLIVVGVSLRSPAPDVDRISGLTFRTLSTQDKIEIRASWSSLDVLATVVVLGLVVGIYLYFSFWLG